MILTENINAVFFDLYGTLLRFNDIKAANIRWIDAFHSYINKRVKFDREELIPVCKGILTSRVEKDKSLGLTTYETKIKNGLAVSGIDLMLEEIKELADHSVCAWQNQITLVDDAKMVLEELGKKYRLALITNFDHSKHIHRVLDEHRLKPFFELIVISDEVEVDKPDPRIFNYAMERMHLRNSEVAFVGDSLNDDMSGALQAGLLPVFISQEDYNSNHEFEIPEDVNDFINKNFDRIKTIKSLSELINNY